jgi:hypothetical protein
VTRRRSAARALLALGLLLVVGCGFVSERRLRGQWRSENTPERTLDLFADGSYSLRLSGKGLGFVSDVLGPEKGTWTVSHGALVLEHFQVEKQRLERWSIGEISSDEVVLAGDRWRRTR